MVKPINEVIIFAVETKWKRQGGAWEVYKKSHRALRNIYNSREKTLAKMREIVKPNNYPEPIIIFQKKVFTSELSDKQIYALERKYNFVEGELVMHARREDYVL